MIVNYKNLPEIIKMYIPSYEYLLIDLSLPQEYDKINLKAEHAIVIETLRRARYESKEQIIEIFIKAIIIYTQAHDKDLASYYIIETISYIISTRDDINEIELKTIADQVSEEGGEIIMTLAERLIERGRQEARQEAMTLAERLREEGIEKNRREMAKNFLRMGIPSEQVAEASELPLKEILELKKEIEN